MRYRLIIETDFSGNRKEFANCIRAQIANNNLFGNIPGEVVYVATDITEPAVIMHEGSKILTRE